MRPTDRVRILEPGALFGRIGVVSQVLEGTCSVNCGVGSYLVASTFLEVGPTVAIKRGRFAGLVLPLNSEFEVIYEGCVYPLELGALGCVHWVQKYRSHGILYYRYVYRLSFVKFKLCRHHIPGGSVRSPVAKRNASLVKKLIAGGSDPYSIVERIKAM